MRSPLIPIAKQVLQTSVRDIVGGYEFECSDKYACAYVGQSMRRGAMTREMARARVTCAVSFFFGLA